jgi:hypothetical protein
LATKNTKSAKVITQGFPKYWNLHPSTFDGEALRFAYGSPDSRETLVEHVADLRQRYEAGAEIRGQESERLGFVCFKKEPLPQNET